MYIPFVSKKDIFLKKMSFFKKKAKPLRITAKKKTNTHADNRKMKSKTITDNRNKKQYPRR